MPNPDGTYTAEEHRREILVRANDMIVNQGMPHDDAIALAGRQWRDELKTEGDRKIAAVEKFLGMEKRT